MSRVLFCLNMINQVKHLDGDVIEMGVANGLNSVPMAIYMSEVCGKNIYCCDTFEGMPYDDENKEGFHKKGHFATHGQSFETIISLLRLTNVKIIKGKIEDTLPNINNKFCFAFLDMDLYQATSFGYKWIEDKIVKGGIIGFHDYNHPPCPGVNQVVDNELDKNKFKEILNDWGCIFFKRK